MHACVCVYVCVSVCVHVLHQRASRTVNPWLPEKKTFCSTILYMIRFFFSSPSLFYPPAFPAVWYKKRRIALTSLRECMSRWVNRQVPSRLLRQTFCSFLVTNGAIKSSPATMDPDGLGNPFFAVVLPPSRSHPLYISWLNPVSDSRSRYNARSLR